jgi:hypothetical protein
MSLMADIIVDPRSIGPITLNRDDREPVPFDHAPRNGRAGDVEFPAAVCGLAKQQDLRIGEPIKVRRKIRCILGRGQRFGIVVQ